MPKNKYLVWYEGQLMVAIEFVADAAHSGLRLSGSARVRHEPRSGPSSPILLPNATSFGFLHEYPSQDPNLRSTVPHMAQSS